MKRQYFLLITLIIFSACGPLDSITPTQSSLARPAATVAPIASNDFSTESATSGEPIVVTDATFETAVLKSALPVIVDFWAPWCEACKALAVTLEKIAKEYEGQLIIAEINVGDEPDWARRFAILDLPSLLFVLKGEVTYHAVGEMSETSLRVTIEQYLGVVQNSN